jgi:localization factor PodJL
MALLLSLVAAGYFVMPRVAPQTGEITREPNSAATISTPKPQANSTMDQELARANAGDAKAMLALGIAYADGTGVTQNDTEAAVWFERAAQAGEVIAQYRLGTRLERGIGVAADASQAVRWYTEAAQRGSAKAMYNLGISYVNGTGIEKNLTEAARWFRSAAELGLTDSQFNLAVMYEHGLGVEVSLAEAYKWYAIAEPGGDMGSKTRAETLATQITAAQKGAADRVVATFKPRLKNPEANEVPAPTGSRGP